MSSRPTDQEPTHVAVLMAALAASQEEHPPEQRGQVNRIGERTPVNPTVRRLVYQRDGGRCRWCHWTPPKPNDTGRYLELDHIVPWSETADDSSTNLRTLCTPCNASRSNANADRFTVTVLPVIAECYACLTGASRPNAGAIAVYCGSCRANSWTIAAYPPL